MKDRVFVDDEKQVCIRFKDGKRANIQPPNRNVAVLDEEHQLCIAEFTVAAIDRAIAEEVLERMEQCCRLTCVHCANGRAIEALSPGDGCRSWPFIDWVHNDIDGSGSQVSCLATDIRNEMRKLRKEGR